jgi:hypothetical protein
VTFFSKMRFSSKFASKTLNMFFQRFFRQALTVMIQKARFPSAERPKTLFFDHFSKEKAKYPSAERPFLASKQTSGRIITVRSDPKDGFYPFLEHI